MNTEKPDYQIAAEKLKELFDSLKLTTVVFAPTGKLWDGVPMIAYDVSFNGIEFEYSLGIGHVKWTPLPYGLRPVIPMRDWSTVENLMAAVCAHKTIKPEYKADVAKIAAALAKRQKVEPKPEQVLAGVCRDTLDAEQTFEDWAADYGYDVDSRKAEKTYRTCQDNGAKARKLVGREVMEKMAALANQL